MPPAPPHPSPSWRLHALGRVVPSLDATYDSTKPAINPPHNQESIALSKISVSTSTCRADPGALTSPDAQGQNDPNSGAIRMKIRQQWLRGGSRRCPPETA
ncbi:hypothetical protein Purlil1_13102 [Purpureocillium lilacinum]|uniref:Uncharacterized protein n=1 Tax=Purpureocillium lilacinum TaxID=33203 RepID=A0ABR0BF64_PURLI|nr:hypothetical protein Purlil1_13102 [Purpureocillium lilacinum]